MEDKDFPYNVEPFLFQSTGGVAIEGEPRVGLAPLFTTLFCSRNMFN
jgi:hypothetical protein